MDQSSRLSRSTGLPLRSAGRATVSTDERVFPACVLIVYIWWPLVVEYLGYIDGKCPWWPTGLAAAGDLPVHDAAHYGQQADLRTDSLIVLVGLAGGLVIESWGTQTNLWFYYTSERPPLWIIPAWPIACLAIDRITRGLGCRLLAQ